MSSSASLPSQGRHGRRQQPRRRPSPPSPPSPCRRLSGSSAKPDGCKDGGGGALSPREAQRRDTEGLLSGGKTADGLAAPGTAESDPPPLAADLASPMAVELVATATGGGMGRRVGSARAEAAHPCEGGRGSAPKRRDPAGKAVATVALGPVMDGRFWRPFARSAACDDNELPRVRWGPAWPRWRGDSYGRLATEGVWRV